MKWIPFAGDENNKPQITSTTIVRFIHTKKVLCEARDFIDKYPHRINTLEYLDEHESLPPAAKNGEAKGRLDSIFSECIISLSGPANGQLIFNVPKAKEMILGYISQYQRQQGTAESSPASPEIERLKGLIEAAHHFGYKQQRWTMAESWNQFKTENLL